jgi:sn-glycerol 3-phosphate transport system permease protein
MNRKGDLWLGWLLLFPTLLVLGLFTILPALESLYMSLFDFNAFMTRRTFVGLSNYTMLLNSPEYWQSLWITLYFVALTAIPSVMTALLIATVLDAHPFFHGALRTVFLLPVAVSSAMAAMLWIFLYNPTAGYLNYIFASLGLSGPNWLGDPQWAIPAVAIASIWKELGFNVIFFLAGLASVPTDLKEAASLDGAGPIQVFRHVTLPILSPTVLFVSVISILNAFQSFGQIHILTMGGPAGSTTTMVYNLYRDAFQNFQTGSASAQAVVLFAVMLLGTTIQFRFARSRVHYR